MIPLLHSRSFSADTYAKIIAIRIENFAKYAAMREIQQYLPVGSPGRCWLRSERRLRDTSPRRLLEPVALHVLSGSMRYFIDGRILTLGPRTLLWAYSDQSHFLLSESTDFDMWVLVMARDTLRGTGMRPESSSTKNANEPHAVTLPLAEHRRLTAIAEELHGKTDADWLRNGLRWWTMQARAASEIGEATTSYRTHPGVQRAIEILEHDPSLALSDVARRSHLSYSRLSRLFKKEVGRTMAEYRTNCRLLRVDEIVERNTNTNLLAAAAAAGFGSYAQFYRCFVRDRQQRPKAYYRRFLTA